MSIQISRAKFEELNADLFRRTLAPVRGWLRGESAPEGGAFGGAFDRARDLLS